MRRLGCAVLLLAVVAFVAFAAALLDFERGVVVEQDAAVEVQAGEGVGAVLARLAREGLIDDDLRWRVWLKLRAPRARFEAGAHALRGGSTPFEVLESLGTAQRTDLVWVTIPEGQNIWQTAELLDTHGVCDGSGFVQVAFDAAVAAQLGVPAESVEGYLFPARYEFARGSEPRSVVARLVAEALARHAALGVEGSGAEPAREAVVEHGGVALSAAEVVTLASLVEEEAQVPDERARIARVFLNRLALGMPLQTDPTCVYGADRWREVPTRARCRDATSRFSTYVIEGLPPTPIASPGVASIEAVLRPAAVEGELYFVAMGDGTGRHAFARTLDEHNANVRRYLRE